MYGNVGFVGVVLSVKDELQEECELQKAVNASEAYLVSNVK
jgi:hypothetical protein